MDAAIVIARTAYFSAVLVLAGEFAFRLLVEQPALRTVPQAPGEAATAQRRRRAVAACAVAVALLSAVVWFVAKVAAITGAPPAALTIETVTTALAGTEFGRVSIVRLALALALVATLGRTQHNSRPGAANPAATIFALGLLCSIAWTGHANAQRGADGVIHLASDLLHLLAAAAWLGALPALAFVLFAARRAADEHALEFAAVVTQRFSIVGIASVATLTLTGLANSWYTTGSLPALVGTPYGRLLAVKLLLFGGMLVLAWRNRFRYTPLLVASAEDRDRSPRLCALHRLGRNAMAEIALGFCIIALVSVFGAVTPPATHVQIVWPFEYTVSWEAGHARHTAIVLWIVTLAAAVLIPFRARRYRTWVLACSAGVAVAVCGALVSLFAVPAHPSTYFRSPVRYSVDSLAVGARLYAQNCSACHGARGHGDGPAAASLARRPTNLVSHVLHHREGELWWWIRHGVPGTPMPAFEGRIEPPRTWDVIHFLRARAAAEEAAAMREAVQSWAVEAPDFTFQIGHQPQESLSDLRGRHNALLVFFDPAHMPERIRTLSEMQGALDRAGVRVIAIPLNDSAAADRTPDMTPPLVANFDPDIPAAYGIFAPPTPQGSASRAFTHYEFLVDERGYIRARWAPGEPSRWMDESYLRQQIIALNTEKPRLSESHGHVH